MLPVEEASKNLDGVGPLLVDIVSAMTSDGVENPEFQCRKRCVNAFFRIFEHCSCINSACASDEKLSLILRVQVDEGFCSEKS